METKHLKALKEIYSALEHTDKLSIRSVLKKHKISLLGCSVLKNGGIIENISGSSTTARYKWKTIPPNLDMANEWQNRIKKLYSDYNKKRTLKKTAHNVDEKYLNVLNEIYTALQYTDKISVTSVMKKYKIDNNGAQVLSKNNIIQNKSESYKYARWTWNTTKPNQEMANNFVQMIREYHKSRRNKSKMSNKKETKRKENGQFAEGNPGKPKGAVSKKINQKEYYLESITFRILFIPIKVKLNYSNKKTK